MSAITLDVLPTASSTATGGIRSLLRVEGLLLALVATLFYFHSGFGGLRFAVLFLVPDLALLGYLVGPRLGAALYNSTHSTIGPLALAALGLVFVPSVFPYALIWLGHVGFDRALGYGLKYSAGFRFTHLGTLGKR